MPPFKSASPVGTIPNMTDRDATWPELHDWINNLFGPNHQLTDIRPTFGDIEYLEKYGTWFPEPGLHGHQRMEPNQCFKNCTEKAWEPGLIYVQGLVAGKIGIVYPHAWITDAEGRCIEPTWDLANYDGSRYFGVPFTLHELATLQLKWKTYDWYEGFAEILSSRPLRSEKAQRLDPRASS
jgi:hypothetical protein